MCRRVASSSGPAKERSTEESLRVMFTDGRSQVVSQRELVYHPISVPRIVEVLARHDGAEYVVAIRLEDKLNMSCIASLFV